MTIAWQPIDTLKPEHGGEYAVKGTSPFGDFELLDTMWFDDKGWYGLSDQHVVTHWAPADPDAS